MNLSRANKTSWLLLLLFISFSTAQEKKPNTAIIRIAHKSGVTEKQSSLFRLYFSRQLKQSLRVDLLPFYQLEEMVKDQGGCNDLDCFLAVGKLLNLDQMIWGAVGKVRDRYKISLHITDVASSKELKSISREFTSPIEDLGEIFFKSLIEEFITEEVRASIVQKPEPSIPDSSDSGQALVVIYDKKKIAIKEKKSTGEDKMLLSEEKVTVLRGGQLTGKLIAKKSPYLLKGNVIIPSGKSLEIEPGVVIKVGGDYSTIVVFGQINARGTKEKPILFKSAKKDPKSWDWDRIYFRSRVRSFLNYVTIQHSNYGVYGINAAVTLDHCTFQNNSISAIYGKRSSLVLNQVVIGKGHISGIILDQSTEMDLTGATITGVNKGIVVEDYAELNAKKLVITNGDKGLIFTNKSKISLQDPDISGNQVGLVSTHVVSEKLSKLIKGNQVKFNKILPEERVSLFAMPAEVKTLKLGTKVNVDSVGFAGGFEAKEGPKEPLLSFIGNISVGAKYFVVEDSLDDGDTIPQKTYVSGIRPEVQIFTNSSTRGNEVSLVADFYHDEHVGYRHNIVNLSMSNPNNKLVLGDFTEDRSENSMSSRRILGAEYKGQALMEDEEEGKLKYKFGVGETQFPLSIGDKKPDIPNDDVDSTSALRQRLVGFTMLDYQINNRIGLGLHYIRSQDMYKSVLRNATFLDETNLQDPSISADLIGGILNLNVGRTGLLSLEWNLGLSDSLHTLDRPDYEQLVQGYINAQPNAEDQDSLKWSLLTEGADTTQVPANIDSLWEAGAEDVTISSSWEDLLVEYYEDSISDVHDSIEEFSFGEDSVFYRVKTFSRALETRTSNGSTQHVSAFEKFLNRSAYSSDYTVRLWGFRHSLFLSRVNPLFYSGGNPYLTQDRALGRYQFAGVVAKKVTLEGLYEYTTENMSNDTTLWAIPNALNQFATSLGKTSTYQISHGLNEDSPQSKHRLNLSVKYKLGKIEFAPTYQFYYDFNTSYNGDSIFVDEDFDGFSDTLANGKEKSIGAGGYFHENEMRNGIDLKAKITFNPKQRLTLSYRPLIIKDFNNHPDSLRYKKLSVIKDKSTGFKQQFKLGMSSKFFKNRFKNKFNIKLKRETKTDKNSLVLSYEIKEKIDWSIIKRKLRLIVTGRRRWYNKLVDETLSGTVPVDSNMIAEFFLNPSSTDETDFFFIQRNTFTTTDIGEATLKYALSSKFSIILSYAYERNYDITEGPEEKKLVGERYGKNLSYSELGSSRQSFTDNNFQVQSGGLSISMLF